MGGCISLNRNSSDSAYTSQNGSPTSGSGTGGGGPRSAPAVVRKNHPLCHETIRWKSDVPLTEGQLRSKRDEFWDTSPAFDGQRVIWDALRAATLAAESLDFGLAQAILDGANVSVPNGYLTECYDELGTQYKVPIYCLSYPINMVKEDNGRESPAEYSEPVDGGDEVVLKLRLSSSVQDCRLTVFSRDTIGQCKKRLQQQEQVDACCQRWFYAGKLLGDKQLLEDARIQPGYVVQVIINQEHANHLGGPSSRESNGALVEETR